MSSGLSPVRRVVEHQRQRTTEGDRPLRREPCEQVPLDLLGEVGHHDRRRAVLQHRQVLLGAVALGRQAREHARRPDRGLDGLGMGSLREGKRRLQHLGLLHRVVLLGTERIGEVGLLLHHDRQLGLDPLPVRGSLGLPFDGRGRIGVRAHGRFRRDPLDLRRGRELLDERCDLLLRFEVRAMTLLGGLASSPRGGGSLGSFRLA